MGTIRDGQPFEDKAYVQKPMCDAAHTSHRIRSDLERQERTSDLSLSSTVIRYGIWRQILWYNPVFISAISPVPVAVPILFLPLEDGLCVRLRALRRTSTPAVPYSCLQFTADQT